MKAVGAGLAGGFLGSMLFKSLGVGGWSGLGAGSGIGLLEVFLLVGLLYLLFRMLSSRSQTQRSGNSSYSSETIGYSVSPDSGSGASSLMRQARAMREERYEGDTTVGTAIDSERAMDLFFTIQGAWASRELKTIEDLLDSDVKSNLEQEVARLKANKKINRLENIAVRTVTPVEAWREGSVEYSTVHFVANLLDFTVDEDSQTVVEGSRSTPVKFEEYWTFAREIGSSKWRLSAIQQH
jgi:predicted lipid-binding transport protein (Tim44 family)